MLNALSVDVEDWFHVQAFSHIYPPSTWDEQRTRILGNVIRTLEILDEYEAKATFFMLGWVAEKFPEVVLLIAERGHEIASHSQYHRLVYNLDRDSFKRDLEKSIANIRAAANVDVRGYRAPSFSIRPEMDWVWEVFSECGIEYDSSVFPIRHDTYGSPRSPRFAYRISPSEHISILEIPPSTTRILGVNVPVAGGGYLRMFPYWFIRHSVRKLNRSGRAAMLYFHPWELDHHQKRIDAGTKSRVRHYTNLKAFDSKLRRLLSDFRFSTIEEVFLRHENTQSIA